MNAFAHLRLQISDLRSLETGSSVVAADGVAQKVTIAFAQQGDVIQTIITNNSSVAVQLHEVILLDTQHGLPSETHVYGEGFTMLAQTGGTLENPIDVGSLPDRTHYRIPEPDNLRTVYGFITLALGSDHLLVGFASCRRFIGRIGFDCSRLRISIDLEGITLMPGESWRLEDLLVAAADDRESLLSILADSIAVNHPRLHWETPPTGWCSWYCYGAAITADIILANLDRMKRDLPELRYVQIDDGYQPWMGDWLETNPEYSGDVGETLHLIREQGFEPAIWVAPFVASPESKLFKEHPDWFVRGDDGAPLSSGKHSFGGWRLGPWYALDGTHPEAQSWLTELFRTMREEWGATYFKLDANFWGALHGGQRHDPRATRVEAYRRGMEAILAGAGDAFVLGCNHPIWPSLGLIHGSRSSGDISRNWKTIAGTGRENLLRGWQNGRLWWNDPDCVVLAPLTTAGIIDPAGRASHIQELSDAEFLFHATVIYASGGMLLSGDKLPQLTDQQHKRLRSLLPPTGRCFAFADDTLTAGTLEIDDTRIMAFFNWTDEPQTHTVSIPDGAQAVDFWTGEPITTEDRAAICLPPRSSRLIIVK